MTLRVPFRTDARAAAVSLLTAYGAAAGLKLQVYRARPRTIAPPCAFVDVVRESYVYTNVTWRLRTPQVEVLVLHGLYDSGEAVDQADAFADGFLDWATDNVHAAGPNTTVGVTSMEDDPTYVPDWLPPAEQRTYFATRMTLEGFAGG